MTVMGFYRGDGLGFEVLALTVAHDLHFHLYVDTFSLNKPSFYLPLIEIQTPTAKQLPRAASHHHISAESN